MSKKEIQTPLKKGRANFTLIGKVAKVNDHTFKLDNEYKSGWVDNIMSIGVDCGNSNVVYAEMRGGYHSVNDSVIYVHGYKEDENGKQSEDYNNRFTIDWDDRFDEDILNTVAKSCFVTVGVEKDDKGKTFVKNFLSPYDAIEYLQQHLAEGTVVNVKGKLSYSGEETVYIKKEITSIFLSKAESENDYKAVFTQTILLDSSSIGKLDKEKNTIGMSAYVVDYVSSVLVEGEKVSIKKSVVFPFDFELENNNPDLTAKILQKFFKVKKGNIHEITVEGKIVEGSAVVEVDDEDIADDIKELIELGFYTEEEAKSKYAVGNTKRERRLLISRPYITYVGDGENRKPTVALDTDKYKESDKVFLIQLLSEVGVSSNSGDDNSNDNDSDNDIQDDDLADFLDSL